MKALLLGILEWSITDDNTGEVKEGINLNYVSPDVFYDSMNGVTGLYPSKCKVDKDIVKNSKLLNFNYPVLANLEFTTTVTPKGKAVAVLSSVKDVKALDIF